MEVCPPCAKSKPDLLCTAHSGTCKIMAKAGVELEVVMMNTKTVKGSSLQS